MTGPAASGPLSTALQCFVAVARHHGVDLSIERLIHDYAIADGEDSATRLLTIARESGFKARSVSLGWHDLSQLGEAYPFLARLDNGNTVIVVGFRREAKGGEAAILDPLADRPGFILLDERAFCSQWSGVAVFLKRIHRLADEGQPFGFRWFIPEFLRQRRIFRDILVAALTLQVLALSIPIFIQIVLDKVLVHQAYTTLSEGPASHLGNIQTALLGKITPAPTLEIAQRSIGSVLKEAEPFFTLVPLDVPLEAEVSIDAKDIGYVMADANGRIKLDAYPFQKHGTLEGTVRTVREDAFTDKDTTEQAFYRSRVALCSHKLRAVPDTFRLIPGMTVTAEIKARERTVLSYFFYPLLRGLDEAIREP